MQQARVIASGGRWRALLLLVALALVVAWWFVRPARSGAEGPAASPPAIAAPLGATAEAPRATPAMPVAPTAASVRAPAGHAPIAAEEPDPPAPETSAPGRSLTELERRARAGDPKAARDFVDALTQCAHGIWWDRAELPNHLNHFSWQDYREQRALRLQWLGVSAVDCQAFVPKGQATSVESRVQELLLEAVRLWEATGDPRAGMVAAQYRMSWPPGIEDWRQQQALASAYLDAGNPQTLVDLAEIFAYGSRYPQEDAWRLAACDLGLDCSAGGSLQRGLCLRGGSCRAGAYEEELLQRLPPRQWQLVQRQRQALLEQLRAGDLRGVFDIPPPGA